MCQTVALFLTLINALQRRPDAYVVAQELYSSMASTSVTASVFFE